ncbi:DUF6412 domain-containing protein [Streptomyces somaliensis]|uniref:DUF6412 domain-containing protein n=1 Tax=Streptomyces somaliensis TaxID=78355 RepID=UPI0020CCD6E5|nr:DUF6412 domain-containing protein [Streptomyces somaliensis]MCP9945713.1 DUF6412 domain-containing protein [Streptomyces somaliensis]MCP9961110.1 DUF6412 domain-containing protein [Streptomyces somaliensis]MCP9973904.1 DUF6412 domain-containing protein [Streptomyces somaliensis]
MYGTFLRLLLPLLLAVVLPADGSPLSAVALAAAALVACAVVGARAVPSVPPTRVRTALRDRNRRTAFLPQRDPDASGRRRPRAPGRRLPAAVAATAR